MTKIVYTLNNGFRNYKMFPLKISLNGIKHTINIQILIIPNQLLIIKKINKYLFKDMFNLNKNYKNKICDFVQAI